MKVQSFQDLLVWSKAHCLVLEIYKMTSDFPDEERFGLISQLRRSSASICSNIAEGYMKSRADFLRFLDISRGSLEETKYHLILSRDLKFCTQEKFNELFEICDQIGRMMYRLKSNLRALTTDHRTRLSNSYD